MKKVIFLSLIIVFIVLGCQNKKPSEYTILGFYTPYGESPEKLSGKVQKVIEKNYWAISDSGKYKKGNQITRKELDSIGWTPDFDAIFDKSGDLVKCSFRNENNRITSKWELIKENNIISSAKLTDLDTVLAYQKLKCNDKGEYLEVSQYKGMVDTLMFRGLRKSNMAGDTIEYQFFNNKNAPTSKWVYIYNKEGQFIRFERHDKDGVLQNANEVKYNEKGKISELKLYDKDRKVTAENYFTYEYDAKGNWIKAIIKDSKGFVAIEEREYYYFDSIVMLFVNTNFN